MRIAFINVTPLLSTGRIMVTQCRQAMRRGHQALLCYGRDSAPGDIPSLKIGSDSVIKYTSIKKEKNWRYDKRRKGKVNPSLKTWVARREQKTYLQSNKIIKRMSATFQKISRYSPHVFFHMAGTRLFDRTGFYSKNATKKFVKTLAIYKPDLIHLHNLHGYYLHIETLFNYIKENDIPVVWTLHDCWAYTGHCAYYTGVKNAVPIKKSRTKTQNNCERWLIGCGQCSQMRHYPSSIFVDQSAKNWVDKRIIFNNVPHMVITTPSIWLKEEVKRSFLQDYPIYAMPNGIDLSEFHPCNDERYLHDVVMHHGLNNINSEYILLSVAAVWDERKGLHALFDLAALLGKDYTVVLVGLDDEQLNTMPDGNVIGLPRTRNIKELCALYTAANLYVTLSEAETMGMTLVEALSCGTQALCYDVTAMPEIVDDEVGAVVEGGNLYAAADAARELCKNPKSAQACMQRAKRYDSEGRTYKYIELYEAMYNHMKD